MSFTMFFFPAMAVLLIYGGVLLVQGVRRRSRIRIGLSLAAFTLVGASMSLLMQFVTRPF